MMLDLPTATSQETADAGSVFVGNPHGGDYLLSDASSWREGALFVLRSSEFDVMAEDEDFETALGVFIARLVDYSIMLHELVEAGDATEEEAEAFRVLSGRLLPLVAMAQSKERRRPRLWRRGSGSGRWRHRGTPVSGSAPLSAA